MIIPLPETMNYSKGWGLESTCSLCWNLGWPDPVPVTTAGVRSELQQPRHVWKFILHSSDGEGEHFFMCL